LLQLAKVDFQQTPKSMLPAGLLSNSISFQTMSEFRKSEDRKCKGEPKAKAKDALRIGDWAGQLVVELPDAESSGEDDWYGIHLQRPLSFVPAVSASDPASRLGFMPHGTELTPICYHMQPAFLGGRLASAGKCRLQVVATRYVSVR
jgi:hypothetical protein